MNEEIILKVDGGIQIGSEKDTTTWEEIHTTASVHLIKDNGRISQRALINPEFNRERMKCK